MRFWTHVEIGRKGKIILKHEKITEEGQGIAALYALGALNQLEARAFENHLQEGCAVCESELFEFEQVVGLIGSSAPAETPQANLRDKLIARIEKEAKSTTVPPATRADVIAFPTAPTHRGSSERSRPSDPLPRKSLMRESVGWAIAALLLLTFAFSFFSWQSDRRALESSVDKMQQQMARLNSGYQEIREINSVLASPGHRVIALKGGKPAPTISANVYWDVDKQRWVVTAEMPPAPAGKAYQLWFITHDARKVSAGVMKTDEKGHVFATGSVPAEASASIKAAAFTLEPEAGSPQPTSDIYAVGEA